MQIYFYILGIIMAVCLLSFSDCEASTLTVIVPPPSHRQISVQSYQIPPSLRPGQRISDPASQGYAKPLAGWNWMGERLAWSSGKYDDSVLGFEIYIRNDSQARLVLLTKGKNNFIIQSQIYAPMKYEVSMEECGYSGNRLGGPAFAYLNLITHKLRAIIVENGLMKVRIFSRHQLTCNRDVTGGDD